MRRLIFVSMLVTTSALMSSAALAATSTVTLTSTSGNTLTINQSGVGTENSSVSIDNSGSPTPVAGNNMVTVNQIGAPASTLESGVSLVDHDTSTVNVNQVGDPLSTATTISEVSGSRTVAALIDVQQANAQAGLVSTTSSAVSVDNGAGDTVAVIQDANSDALSGVRIDGVGLGLNRVGVLQAAGINLNSLVRISGTENVVDVFQDLGAADATSNVSIAGDRNTGNVLQSAGTLVVSAITVTGNDNGIIVDQVGGTNLNSDIDITGDLNRASVIQKDVDHISVVTILPGNANIVDVAQAGSLQRSEISIAGDANTTTVTQTGGTNSSNVAVTGNTNQTTVNQTDFGHTSLVTILPGIGNIVDVAQAGEIQFSDILIDGDGNIATVRQAGGNNGSDMDVFGDKNQVSVAQDRANNKSMVLLDGPPSSANTILVEQFGVANASNIHLVFSDSNSVTHRQLGVSATASTSMSGSVGNTVTIVQN